MAVGDTVSALVSKANNATLDLQPAAGVEWFVNVLLSEQGLKMEVYVVDDAAGSNKKLVDTIAGGSLHGLTFRVTNTVWIQLKNTSGSTQFIGYMGVVSKA